MTKVFLVRNRRKRLEQGHPWIFRSEVERIEGEFTPGDIVEVVNHQGHFLGRGYINPESQMIVRLLTTKQEEEINQELFISRIRQAWSFRRRFLPDIRSCRVLYGEADFMPGLVVDKFEDVLVVQILSLGMEVRKEWILHALLEVFSPKAIYLRNDVYVRELEGLEQEKGFWYGESETEIQIEENGLKLIVDIEHGQKTGYFFDQRENRASIAPLMTGWGEAHGIRMQEVEIDGKKEMWPVDRRGKIVKNPFWDGAEVLDCFTHTGSFTLNACKYGAKKVTTLDISDHAIETAKRNVQLNGFLHRVEFVVANAFDYLREAAREGRQWDVVILDPPAFAKSRSAVKGALRGYKDINLNGLKLVRDGGYLVTASCSYHMSPELFEETIQEAAMDAKKILRLLRWSGAGVDHPKLTGADEGDYLKFAIYEVRSRV
ncbi:class I SAM-dependent rRNA methyltransferase [Aneurinibacillus thermoaerophilus]|uniref:class I SAM-dependent rRNA methyltransferase n=1 Tax=Aneurinibacillus thermoaerophilus TaxID=143495 RepID=UPI002E1E12C6|nr:class I SAM-dependent rRNA methyltransferase [Aneurinibacillus thermoaerophilus]MED0757316.1 class I SAM-dependent rRNA methyltransferase [Aneurinibacillus thermoaerophilus]MED0761447.1 class I SAM-dependent rRNA methyltransferase [Aneurinibacillus thermoaerophilus]